MILVDTSVWVDHLRHSEPHLIELLRDGTVLTHPLVTEELACGNLSRRERFLQLMKALPKSPSASHSELLHLVGKHKLFDTGLGAVDAHLIASTMLSNAELWSKDRPLRREADKLGLGHSG